MERRTNHQNEGPEEFSPFHPDPIAIEGALPKYQVREGKGNSVYLNQKIWTFLSSQQQHSMAIQYQETLRFTHSPTKRNSARRPVSLQM